MFLLIFLSRFYIAGCEFIKLGRVDSGLLFRHYIFRFFFIFDIRLLNQLYDFFILFYELFQFYFMNYTLINLI